MSKKIAKNSIDTMGIAARENRLRAADYFLSNPHDFKYLLFLAFDIEYPYHHKAAWVLEFVLEKQLNWIVPHLDFFTEKLHSLKNDSALRPTAKICKWIAEIYVKKKNPLFISQLKKEHIDLIIESGFDWMIGQYRVATKVYTMDTLYLFGSLNIESVQWVHPELQNIILLHLPNGSSGYKSHGKMILRYLDKNL